MKQAIICVCLLTLGISGCTEPENHLTQMAIGNGSLEVRYLDTFGFGSHTVRFCYHGPDGERFLAQTELHNDGANLGQSNFELVVAEDGHPDHRQRPGAG